MILTMNYEGHNRMFAMRDPEDENMMLLFVEDHFEIWPHTPSVNGWFPELAEKYGEKHAFSQSKAAFYAPLQGGCEHEWEGTSEINVRLMAAAPELLEEVKKLREVIKTIKDCATINAQHDDTLQEEWEYILEVMRCTEED